MAETDDAVDRISELPPFIVHHIMSYLSAEEVAQTCILSKRWYHLWTSFPILDFDQTLFIRISVCPNTFLFWRTQKSFCEEVRNFLRFVDVSVDRLYEKKVRMQKFRLFISLVKVRKLSSFVDKWIGLAVKSGVKELDVNVITDKQRMYTLPRTFFSAKFVTALKLGYCKLDLPLETIIRFHSLRKLTLEEVCINEQTVQKLTSDCPLLEDLFFKECWGLKSYCIYKACNLKILEIDLPFHQKDVERIEIVVPSLQKFSLRSAFFKMPLLIEMAGCTNLKILNLSALRFMDQYFHGLISKLSSLEELSVGSCPSLKTVIISSIRLKKLYLCNCENLKALEVDALNLLYFG